MKTSDLLHPKVHLQQKTGMHTLILFFILTIGGLCSCEVSQLNPEGEPNAIEGLISDLKSSPENVKIGDKEIILTAYPYYDLMPTIIEQYPKGLLCGVQLSEKDSSDISTSITLNRLYVVNGNEL